VILLGIDTVQSLVLSLGIFSSFGAHHEQHVEKLWQHSNHTGSASRKIARKESLGEAQSGTYLTAGLLHDIGKLVISTCDSRVYRKILEVTAVSERPQWEIEQDELGCTHAEIGAFLLGIWGLPMPIVEAVAWHHRPSASPVSTFSPLVAVHVADALHHQATNPASEGRSLLDGVFLERAGLSNRLDVWAQELAGTAEGEEMR
jgi:HD-like signal output (HDOD) protein